MSLHQSFDIFWLCSFRTCWVKTVETMRESSFYENFVVTRKKSKHSFHFWDHFCCDAALLFIFSGTKNFSTYFSLSFTYRHKYLSSMFRVRRTANYNRNEYLFCFFFCSLNISNGQKTDSALLLRIWNQLSWFRFHWWNDQTKEK